MSSLIGLFSRHTSRLSVPALALISLLQRTPVLRVAATAGDFVLESPVGSVLRAALATAASVGAMHSLAGATTLSAASSPNPVSAGTFARVAFNALGAQSAASSWTVTGSNVPSGMYFSASATATSGATSGIVNTSSGTLYLLGTPASAGSYSLSLKAWEGANGTQSSANLSYTLTVSGAATTPPTITTQPQSKTVTAGETVTFTVVAGGTAPFTYQWSKDGAAISGQTTASLTIPTTTTSSAGTYTVAVTNTAGTTVSAGAVLTVNALTAPTITSQPSGQTVQAGQTVTFSVVATGVGSLTYQWFRNNVAVTTASATGFAFSLSPVQTTDAGSYTVVVANSVGSTTSSAAVLVVTGGTTPAPAISTQPVAQTVASGGTVVFSAAVTNATSYQWRKNGTAIPGATGAMLVMRSVAVGDAGSYSVVATNAGGSVTSSAAALTVATTSDSGRLINLSIRTFAGTSDQTLFVGLAVGGVGGGTQPVLMRATGPALTAFGVPGVLTDPFLTLIRDGATVAFNDNWSGASQLSTVGGSVGAFPLTNSASKDAVLYQSAVAVGTYSVKINGADGGTGIALAELYDATPSGSYNVATSPRLINVSARAQVNTGDGVLIAGFAIGGTTAKTVLIRAIGPTLTGFGVNGALADPVLELSNGSGVLALNDNWGGDAQVTTVGGTVGAFPLPDGTSKDAVLLVTLPPGTYSAKVSGVSNGTGVALVELYDIP